MDFIKLIKNNLIKIFIVIGIIIAIVIGVFVFLSMDTSNVNSRDSYIAIEKKLVKATKIYFRKNPNLLPDVNEEKKVSLQTLINAKVIRAIKNRNHKDQFCTGEVVVLQKENEEYIYKPYLKCGKDYETTYLSNLIIEKDLVTEGEGLYEVGDKYIFKGDKPNNYVTIGEDEFRIISINEDNEIKLISTSPTRKIIYWDNRYNSDSKRVDGINDFNKSRVRDFLIEYIDNPDLPQKIKDYIIKKPLCIGKRNPQDTTTLDGSIECSTLSDEMYFGLIQVNEYYNASTDPNCTNTTTRACTNYNFFSEIFTTFITQTASAANTNKIYTIDYGILKETDAKIYFSPYVVFYLDKDVIYNKGDGTKEAPYKLRI